MKVTKFESLSVDEGLDLLKSKVANLSRPQAAAFFGSVGAALLPLYVRFSERNAWGDIEVLRTALETALRYAVGKGDVAGTNDRILESIARIIPDEHKFEVPEATFAMDAAICIDSAVRAADPAKEVDPAWVEYALDPVISLICQEETGYLEVGSSAKGNAWRSQALTNPRLRAAFEALSEMADLSQFKETLTLPGLEKLQRLGARLFPDTHVSP